MQENKKDFFAMLAEQMCIRDRVFRTGGYAAVGGHAEANIKPNGRFAAWADVRSHVKEDFL